MFSLCCTRKWQQCLEPRHVCFPLWLTRICPVSVRSPKSCAWLHTHTCKHKCRVYAPYSFEGISTNTDSRMFYKHATRREPSHNLCTLQLPRAPPSPLSVHEYFMFSLSKSGQGYCHADTQLMAILTSSTRGTVIVPLDCLLPITDN